MRTRRALQILVASVVLVGVIIPAISFGLPADLIEEFLEVQDPLARADFIYLLGGDYELRAPAAAALFRQGWSPLIVVARESAALQEPLNGVRNFTDVTKTILYANGVPESAVLELRPQPPVNSTADEAKALRAFVAKRAPARIIILTSSVHCRRARMMMRRMLRGSHVDVRVWPVEPQRVYTDSEIRKELAKFLFRSLTFW